MTRIAERSFAALMFVGLAVPAFAEDRPADAIVRELEREIKASRRGRPSDEFFQGHTRIAELVDELRRSFPDDARVSPFLRDRWYSLIYLGKQGQVQAETEAILSATKDPALRNDALYLKSRLGMRETDNRATAVSLAEEFARLAPHDNRAAELLYQAAGRLDDAWYIHLGLLVALALAGALALAATRKRHPSTRRVGRFAARLGALGLLTVVVVLCAYHAQSDAKRAEIIAFVLGTLEVISARIHQVEPLASFLLRDISMKLGREVWTGRVGLAVVLAVTGALVAASVRLRSDATEGWRRRAIRLGALGFVTILTLLCALDAAIIGLQRSKIRERIATAYPDSFRGRMIRGERRQRERIGEPFDLAFHDAITGKPISMKDLREKVVVVDFWATWCGPCVAEIPAMTQLYAEYRDQGVEFIGVSLDLPEEDGGLEALKAFVAKEQIAWPQYYQAHDNHRIVTGTPTDDFSESWGINGIPTVFIIDTEGKLYSTEARGKLETLIPKLLRRKDSPGR